MMRTTLAALAVAAAACAPAAHAAIVTFTGTTAGAPTFQRPVDDFSALSGIGTNVAYRTWLFSVSVAGEYTFLTTAAFDAVTLLYGTSFNAASPLANGLAGNDDLVSPTTSGFAAQLVAGAQYVHVTTGFDNGDVGNYSLTVGGPGLIAAVPEVSSWLAMAGGLGALAGVARRRRVTAGV